MKTKPETALERSLGLIFRDKDRPQLGILPKWERTFVGDKCVVLRFQDTMVAGGSGEDGGRLGKIFTTKIKGDLKVRLELPPYYEHQKSRGGLKHAICDDLGNPVYQVMLLLAARTDETLDRYVALCGFIENDKELADQLLATVKTVTPAEVLESNDSHPLMTLTCEPLLFRQFVDQWELRMFEEDRVDDLDRWRAAAIKTLKRLREIRYPDTYSLTALDWVLPAIKVAAKDCEGLPHQLRHREILKKSLNQAGKDDFSKETTRGALDTLGFSWIPGRDVWKKYWKPHFPKGWE